MGYKQRPYPQSPAPEAPDKDVLLMQYQLMTDTYIKYLDLTLKFALFSYAVTGAIVSFCLSRPAEGVIKFGLFFPILMNLFFAGTCFLGAHLIRPMFDEVDRVTTALKLEAFPEVRFLTYVLLVLGVLFVIITVALVIISYSRF